MDCLRHYCVQLDFEAREMRFMEPDAVNPSGLGKAFPLTFSREGCPFLPKGSFVGREGALIDTGFDRDGALRPKLFQRAVREQSARAEGEERENARFSKCVWDGNTYTDLVVGRAGNTLGLRFLARHLVTFDFQRKRLYLKRTSVGPLYDENTQLLLSQVERCRLPGFSEGDHGEFNCLIGPCLITLDGRKMGDPSFYHYRFTRASTDEPWRLHKAWRADQNDRVAEEYPVPETTQR